MAKLYENGMTRIEIILEYDLTLSIFSNWINTGSFNHQDNLISDDKCSYHFANITRYSQQNVEFKMIYLPKTANCSRKWEPCVLKWSNKSNIIETLIT